MKVKELLTMDVDIDVLDDICDALEIAFVGPAKLTDEGLKEFADVLEYEVKLHEDDGYCIIPCDDDPSVKWRTKLHKAAELFYALAGYCSAKDYDKWFLEGFNYDRDFV